MPAITPDQARVSVQKNGSTKPKQRIQALDVIRGVSILGILAVNADGYAAPISASLKPAMWFFQNEGWTAISYWIMDTIFHDKFLSMFSMLFGISLFLVGGERSDRPRSRILARRLFFLFLFGMLHGFGIWWGDILSLYAVTGALMFFCRSWRPRMLMAVGLILYLGMTLWHFPVTDYAGPGLIHHVAASIDPSALTAQKANVSATLAEAKASWAGAYSVNTQSYRRVLSGYPWLIPSTLGLMMIGLSLFKSGFLAAKSDTRGYLVTVMAAIPALGFVGWLCWQEDVMEAGLPGTAHLLALLAPLIVLGYASILILILRTRWSSLLSPFAAAGRMAFTNYLTQSLIMTSIFYGGRGALMGEVDRPGLWLIVIAIWALQLVWSKQWLSHFEMGPFEWIWRMLTHGRVVRLVRTPQADKI